MSSILYYSNYCQHSQKMISQLSKSKLKKDIHFACIDNREKKQGRIYLMLPNGMRLILPPHIARVPALFLMKDEGRVLYGDDIYNFFKPKREYIKKESTSNNGEPLAFSYTEMGNGMSDNYAYLDQSPDELSAKGNGGMRQLHHFSTLNQLNSIETPPDNYEPDKIGSVDMGKLQAKRHAEINQKHI